MDEGFLQRAKRLLGERAPPRLDHHSFCARIAARQADTPTAQASAAADAAGPPADEAEALVVLVLAAPGWRSAAHSQAGCFNRAAAKRRVNTR